MSEGVVVGVCPACGKSNNIAGVTEADAKADASRFSECRIDVSCDHCGVEHRLYEFVERQRKIERKRAQEQAAAKLRASLESAKTQRRKSEDRTARGQVRENAYASDEERYHDAVMAGPKPAKPTAQPSRRPAPPQTEHADFGDLVSILREQTMHLKRMRSHLLVCRIAAFVYLIPFIVLCIALIFGGTAALITAVRRTLGV
jgi:hypothetical protein